MAKDERFIKTYSQGKMTVSEIWVDCITGVNYLFHEDGYAGGLTASGQGRQADRVLCQE